MKELLFHVSQQLCKRIRTISVFQRLWEFGKYASTCEHGKLYLEIAGHIIELLKENDFKELKPSLNGFYKVMSTYWDISTLGNNEDWETLLQDMDKLCDSVPENQKKSVSNMMVNLSDYFQEQYKEYKKYEQTSPKR